MALSKDCKEQLLSLTFLKEVCCNGFSPQKAKTLGNNMQ